MVDDVLINKAATIERCVQRAREEYFSDPASFATNFSRQDAAILNIQRACEAALDMGQHLIRRDRLGVPQSARDVFALLARAGRIEQELAAGLQRMVGFRNIAVHDYQSLQLPITVAIIEKHLDEFLQYSKALLLPDAVCLWKTKQPSAPWVPPHLLYPLHLTALHPLHCRPPAAPGCVSSATGRVTGACGCFVHWCWSACLPSWSATTSP